jgi:hypothetical protein
VVAEAAAVATMAEKRRRWLGWGCTATEADEGATATAGRRGAKRTREAATGWKAMAMGGERLWAAMWAEGVLEIGGGRRRKTEDLGEGEEKLRRHGGTHELGRRIGKLLEQIVFWDENIFTPPPIT